MSQAPTLTKANSRPRAMNELALFAGAGGGILGGQILGWRTVCAVEREPYAAGVLVARQNDGSLPPFPIWDDVCTFDGRPWRGIVDVVSGGFPCQDISVAGKGAGIDGERSGLWGEMARIIGEVRPRFAFVENSPALVNRGLGRVIGDLAALGYDCRWTVLSAADVGAPHRRERIWIVANARGGRLSKPGSREVQQQGRTETERASDAADAICKPVRSSACENMEPEKSKRAVAGVHGGDEYVADSDNQGQLQQGGIVGEVGRRVGDRSGVNDGDTDRERLAQRQGQRGDACQEFAAAERTDWWQFKPGLGGGSDGMAEGLDRLKSEPWGGEWEDGTPRVAVGVPARVDRLKAIGNGQVPQCAAAAWRLLTS